MTVKLLLVPLPCTGIRTIGAAAPPNTLMLNTASPNTEGGLTVPNKKLEGGCGVSGLLKSYLTCNSGLTIPSADIETLT